MARKAHRASFNTSIIPVCVRTRTGRHRPVQNLPRIFSSKKNGDKRLMKNIECRTPNVEGREEPFYSW